MASATGKGLPHRTVANIRALGTQSPGGQTTPSSPHTPLRTTASTFGSPSSVRAEDDTIVIEFGARQVRVGFAGDAAPRTTVTFGPQQQRRVGDFRAWQVGHQDEWRKRESGEDWGGDHELWEFDIRGLDLDLLGDKIERGLREAFTKHLVIDSRPRRTAVVLSSAIPLPLLSTILDTLFNRFQSPYVSLLSSPVMSTAAAGVRSALVVDLGWAETVVTSVYEYREVACSQTVRGGKRLAGQVHKLLARALAEKQGKPIGDDNDHEQERLVSFDECEEVTVRMVWCKPAAGSTQTRPSDGLPTVTETDESELTSSAGVGKGDAISIPLASTIPPTTLAIPFDQLADPCENTFFEKQYSQTSWDDHELPVHQLIFRHLLQLPMDVRAACMSRIIFTGGCSNILGLRGRIFDELSQLVDERGWDPVMGRATEQFKANPKLQRRGGTRQATSGPTSLSKQTGGEEQEQDGVWHDAANAVPEVDPVEEQLKRGRDEKPDAKGQLRAIESLGAWAGASLLVQLKVPAIATIDRELWVQQGAAGSSRVGEVDLKPQQRQSLGAGGLIRAPRPVRVGPLEYGAPCSKTSRGDTLIIKK